MTSATSLVKPVENYVEYTLNSQQVLFEHGNILPRNPKNLHGATKSTQRPSRPDI